jgi:N-methylhydantoinase A
VPRYPGITSAMGLLTTDLKHDLIQNEFTLSTDPHLDKLNGDLQALEDQVKAQLQADGFSADQMTLQRFADCRYVGQGYELRAMVPNGELDEAALQSVWQQFHDLHTAEYGHAFPENPVELVTLRVTGTGPMPKLSGLPVPTEGDVKEAWLKTAVTYFRVNGQLEEYSTNFFERDRLPVGGIIEGPAVIFQKDSTVSAAPPQPHHRGSQRQPADSPGGRVLNRQASGNGSSGLGIIDSSLGAEACAPTQGVFVANF